MDKGSSEGYVIAHADKTVLRISGLSVRGLNAGSLEELLSRRLGSVARVIGVTGSSVEMDLYGVEEEQILKDANGIIKTVALAQGITLTDLAEITKAEKIVPVHFSEIPGMPAMGCAKERWLRHE